MAVTTQMIKDIIDIHNEQHDLAPVDIADLTSIPYSTVTNVLQGYEALIGGTASDIEYLKKRKTLRPLYNAMIGMYGLEDPFGKPEPKKKSDPKPKKPKEEPKAAEPERQDPDVMEMIRKKMESHQHQAAYHKARSEMLAELLHELKRDMKEEKE